MDAPDLPEGLTQADLDRYTRLDKGIKDLQAEHKELGTKIKEAFAASPYGGKQTLVYPSEKFGAIAVKLGEQNRLPKEGLAVLEALYPQADFPQYWIAKLSVEALPPKVVAEHRETILTLSVDVVSNQPPAPRRATAG